MSVAVSTINLTEEELVFTLAMQVSSSYDNCRESRLDSSELHKNIMQLERFIFSYGGNEEKIKAIIGRLNPEMIGNLNEAYCFWKTRIEFEFAQRLSRGRVSLPDYPLNDEFSALIRRELALVSGLQPERVLFIGSGPLPISAIHLHMQTGAPVDCLVRDPGVVAIARDVLASCGLGRGISPFVGTSHPCSGRCPHRPGRPKAGSRQDARWNDDIRQGSS